MPRDPILPQPDPKRAVRVRKAGKSPYGAGQENMPKPYPQRKLKPAVKDAMGIMGSTSEQAKQRKEKALADMRKRGMLRKKQG